MWGLLAGAGCYRHMDAETINAAAGRVPAAQALRQQPLPPPMHGGAGGAAAAGGAVSTVTPAGHAAAVAKEVPPLC